MTVMTPADRIERACAEQRNGDHTAAQTHALIAIAELLSANLAATYIEGAKIGAEATAKTLAKVLGITLGWSEGDAR